MGLLVVCVSSHGVVGRWSAYDSGHSHFWDVCADTELTKVASGMRHDFYSMMPDHKQDSKRVK